MAYNRYRRRERFKRQYTFTRTKAVVGFLLSALFSITLSAYFDRYGLVIFRQVKQVVKQSLGVTAEAAIQQSPATPYVPRRRP